MRGILKDAYSLLSELFCNPQDVDVDKVKESGYKLAMEILPVEKSLSDKLTEYLNSYPPSEEDYIECFELSPSCPLYLGAHLFSEPKTCAYAGVSERNEYMLELLNIYEHFGLVPVQENRELPDFLPLILEFLALTVEKDGDPLREKCIREYILPPLEPMRQRLQEINSSYHLLVDVLLKILQLDLEINLERKEVKQP